MCTKRDIYNVPIMNLDKENTRSLDDPAYPEEKMYIELEEIPTSITPRTEEAVTTLYHNKEQDPTGKAQHEPGAKLDAEKPDLSLLLYFGAALRSVGEVGTVGARKYTRGGWQEVSNGTNRYTAAMLRHLFAENQEEIDAETGLYHAAQVAWNALARLELMLREKENE